MTDSTTEQRCATCKWWTDCPIVPVAPPTYTPFPNNRRLPNRGPYAHKGRGRVLWGMCFVPVATMLFDPGETYLSYGRHETIFKMPTRADFGCVHWQVQEVKWGTKEDTAE